MAILRSQAQVGRDKKARIWRDRLIHRFHMAPLGCIVHWLYREPYVDIYGNPKIPSMAPYAVCLIPVEGGVPNPDHIIIQACLHNPIGRCDHCRGFDPLGPQSLQFSTYVATQVWHKDHIVNDCRNPHCPATNMHWELVDVDPIACLMALQHKFCISQRRLSEQSNVVTLYELIWQYQEYWVILFGTC